MDEIKYMESLLSSLKKPQNCKRLLQILVALRKQVNAPDHKTKIRLIEFNSLKALIACTQYDANSKVVDLALSVLGNCCTNRSISKQAVYDLNILHNLHRVLEKFQKDSIHGRVFRILGNLCDAVEQLRLIKKEPSVITYVLKYLEEFSNDGAPDDDHKLPDDEESEGAKFMTLTVSMALRFVRKLLVPETFQTLVSDFHVINIVGLLLIKCSNAWLRDKNDDILINDVIKIIQIISSSMCSFHDVILPELKNATNGDALKSLGDIVLFHPEKIIKILLKFAPSSKYQSDLPIEAVISNLLKAIQVNSESSGLQNKEYLESVNKLMNHIGFHDKLNYSNNIGTLIKLLKDFNVYDDTSIHCCIQMFSILNKCKYNDNLVKSQLKDNVILVMIEKLEQIAGKPSGKILVAPHEIKCSTFPYYKNMKRFKPTSPEMNNSRPIEAAKNFEKYVSSRQYCASPSSCSDISSCGPFSPESSTILMCDDSDSDIYSPLCSENEAEDELKIVVPDDDVTSSEPEDNRPIYNQDQMVLCYKLRDEMNALLKFYCTIKPLYAQLGNPKLITILINIVLDFSMNEEKCDLAYSIVVAIIQTPEFLLPIMMTGLIPQVYELIDTKHDDRCVDCDILQSRAEDIISKFVSVGQTECVKGDIAYLLLGKTNEDMKEKLIITVPYIIRSSNVIRKLMKECGGLSILIRLLKNRADSQVQKKSLKSICILAADNLKIQNPVYKKIARKKTKNMGAVHVGPYKLPLDCENVVIFKLDDGSCVKADRDALNNESDYFSALLSGQFIESKQTEINLKNVARESLNCILQLLTLDIKLKATLHIEYDLDTILDVILLTDRFLLNNLNYALICHAEQLLNLSTVTKFYKWSIESGTDIMRIESIAFILVSDISYKEKLSIFYTLFDLNYFDELIEDVEKLITQFL